VADHENVGAGRKTDPGARFDWSRSLVAGEREPMGSAEVRQRPPIRGVSIGG